MIRLDNICVNYGKVAALSAVSLVGGSRDKIYAVLGANGAGKTSLLRAILGLNNAKGAIQFDGADISRLTVVERVRRGIALVPEGRRLFPDFTVEENLKIGACNRSDRAEVGRDIEEICDIFPILRDVITSARKACPAARGKCSRSAGRCWRGPSCSCSTSPRSD